MTKRTLFYLFLLGLTAGAGAQPARAPGYEIKIKLAPFQKRTVVLAHYYGSELQGDASAILNEKSEAVFKGNERLHPGIYVIYDENRESMIDFLVGEDQHFSIEARIGENDQTIRFSESDDNTILNRYKQFMAFREMEIGENQAALESASQPADSARILQRLKEIDDTVYRFREELIRTYPGTLLSSMLAALREPVLPPGLRQPVTHKDSLERKQFLAAHFWDGVDFRDSHLLYTPFFESKLERYYTDIIDRQPDSVIKAIDAMMRTAMASESMTRFILQKLFFGSMEYRFKWEDAVFIHLYERYLADKSWTWLAEADRKKLTGHAFTLMANKKGTKARDINLPGMDGKNKSLLSLASAHTLLCFWDVTCSHCRETLPVLDSLYRHQWKQKGLKIYAVSMESEGTREDWLQFIRSNHLEAWTHVYYAKELEMAALQKGIPSALQSYNIWYYPSFYVLDKEHRLLAEKMKYPAVTAFLQQLFKKNE